MKHLIFGSFLVFCMLVICGCARKAAVADPAEKALPGEVQPVESPKAGPPLPPPPPQ